MTVCEQVAPRLNKHDDVIEWNFMKIVPPPKWRAGYDPVTRCCTVHCVTVMNINYQRYTLGDRSKTQHSLRQSSSFAWKMVWTRGHQTFWNYELLPVYRLMRRATNLIQTYEIKILLNLPSIILVLIFLNVKTLIMLILFLEQARGRLAWSMRGLRARGHHVGDSWFKLYTNFLIEWKLVHLEIFLFLLGLWLHQRKNCSTLA